MDRAQRKLALKAIREAEWVQTAAPEVKLSPHRTFGQAR
jgi:peptide deformylase